MRQPRSAPAAPTGSPGRGRPVAALLMEQGRLAPSAALRALGESRRSGTDITRVLLAEDTVSPADLRDAMARHCGVLALDRASCPPDPALADLLPPETCLRLAALPWMRAGATLVIATAQPQGFAAVLQALAPDCGPVAMALALESDIHAEIALRHGDTMARAAEAQVPAELSCRDISGATPRQLALAGGLALTCLALLVVWPVAFFGAALALALLSLLLAQITKGAALLAGWRRSAPAAPASGPLPEVSLLVPLFREEHIADTLVRRLSRLDYPRALLEVLLVLEAGDDLTRRTLARTPLPPWIRTVTVPEGPVTTKPRALNYALRFARGQIIGIYDAEDSPSPDQIRRVAHHFERAPPQVACVQGILDFYNPRANWLARCFTIEYATWFRILLPGLARLGFPVPLGGTTVFFRREALDHVGGWDAHNVTEDADLGVRLARFGYVTDLLATPTREEANNRPWPWVRQRSRWLKGYMMTWAVHMRRPRQLWRDLGPWGFAGFQLIFVPGLLQALLAPVLWSFWLVLAGLPHPLASSLSAGQMRLLVGTFLTAEAVSLLCSLAAVARSPHGGLLPVVPTLFLYYPLGTLAAYKALWELLHRPFYWDKTMHGHSAPDHDGADLPESAP